MAETFLAILTAHLLGDFVFQSRKMVEHKDRISVLSLHVVIVTVTTAILLRGIHWPILTVVFFSHAVFDALKVHLSQDTARPFILDQLAHLAVAILLAATWSDAAFSGWWPQGHWSWQPAFHAFLCLVSGGVLAVPAGGILIGKLTVPIRQEIEDAEAEQSRRSVASSGGPAESSVDDLTDGLQHGGLYIGWLERFLTMLLVLIGQTSGIGFLIAAKSILRFGEIRDSRHRKVAEYIIIGTFLSFGWAILIAFLTQRSIGYWIPEANVTGH